VERLIAEWQNLFGWMVRNKAQQYRKKLQSDMVDVNEDPLHGKGKRSIVVKVNSG